jgi:hypothetical protein
MDELGDDLGLERVELRAKVDHGEASIPPRERRGGELGVEHGSPRIIRRPSWTGYEGGDDGDGLLQLGRRRPNKLRMVVEDAGQALLGHMEAADVGQAEGGPLSHCRTDGGQPLSMHGQGSSGLVCRPGQEDAQVADVLARADEADTCGRVNAIFRRDVRVSAEEDALGLVDVETGPTGRPVEGDSLKSRSQVIKGVEVEGGVIGMLMGGRRRRSIWKADGAEGASHLQVEEVGGERLRLHVVKQRRERAALRHARGDREGPRAVAVVQDLGE